MLINYGRTLALTLSFGLIAACGMGGSGGGKKPLPPGTGGLNVSVTGLPSGVAAAVKVAGPNNFTRELTASQNLTALTPGSYTVTATSLLGGTLSYVAAAPAQTVTVPDTAIASVTVSYAATPLTIALQEVATVSNAVFLTAPAGDARQFIVERQGRVRILQNGALLPTPFLDISGRVAANGEGGLLSLAFHPQYATNGYFFVYYTDAGNNIIVERRKVSGNANVADSGSALEIIRIAHPNQTNHYGGLVSFGPDGMLYLATGDGGGSGDPQRNAQNLNSLLGKMLRLDVANSSTGQTYAIPTGNPYAGQAGRRGEIWASGLRNPWRYAFDSDTLYIADVGQERREEVNRAPVGTGGINYGWNTMEGTACFVQGCSQTGLTLPFFEYDHGSNDANGCSITGGYVYRGKAIPELAGRYFYSDYCKGFLKSFYASANAATEQVQWTIPDIKQVVSFGRDAEGELYLIADTGKIYRLTKAK